jgi:hypothetical protein
MTPEKIALKRAFAEMVRGVGGVEASAPFCRVGKTKLAEYYSESMPDRFAPIDVIADLEPMARERSGWPHVTSALCKMMGGTFLALPDRAPTTSDVFALLAALSKELSDTTGVVCKAMADGAFDDAEAAATERELDQLIAVAVEMRAHVRSIQQGEQ